MALSLGLFQAQIGDPFWDPDTFAIQFGVATLNLQYDDATGYTNLPVLVAQNVMNSCANPIWQNLINPFGGVARTVFEQQTIIDCDFPYGYAITLHYDDDWFDSWYQNTNIKKIGMLRRLNKGFADPPVWLNARTNTGNFGPPKGDQVELIIPPNVWAEVTIYPWLGIPPCEVGTGGLPQFFNNGWPQPPLF